MSFEKVLVLAIALLHNVAHSFDGDLSLSSSPRNNCEVSTAEFAQMCSAIYKLKTALNNDTKKNKTPQIHQPSTSADFTQMHVAIRKLKSEVEKQKNIGMIEQVDLNVFDKMEVDIDQVRNVLRLKGLNSAQTVDIKSYIVSTGKKEIKKPLGYGGVSNIVFNPVWYPTDQTIEYFKNIKGINLPREVPAGDKMNFLGPVKIMLTHKVDGRDVYRIHGTLNESTIGTHESGGCVRMRNKDALELATVLEKFANKNSLDAIKVNLR